MGTCSLGAVYLRRAAFVECYPVSDRQAALRSGILSEWITNQGMGASMPRLKLVG